MTEAEWLTCDDPRRMLEAVRGRASGRKLRLFAVGCCRLAWNPFATPVAGYDLWVAEDLADHPPGAGRPPAAGDGPTTRTGYLGRIAWAANLAGTLNPRTAADRASVVAALAAADVPRHSPPREGDEGYAAYQAERRAQAALLREVLGNPFRPIALDPRWKTADVVGLARGIYEDRAFRRLPPLADALMDAGCDHDELLAHCRSAGPHVRGCWVVDLALGRE